MKNVFVVIPSLDPDEKLKKTVDGLREAGFVNFILVDDGSQKINRKFFPKKETGIVLLRHKTNKGKGAAMKTAFEYILKNCPKAEKIVTVDGDGQHLPKDVAACVEAVSENNMVLGCRNFNLEHVPKRSRFGNHTTSRVFKLLCGISISDTQTGLRAYPASLLEFLLTIEGDRFEYETNSLLKFKQAGYGFTEVEIETVYIEENKTSHFRTVRDSLRVYSFILKFILSSISSFLVDIIIFFLLNFFFGARLGAVSELVCTAVARAVSSFFNFNINRKKVFSSGANYGKTFLKYYAVAIPQMLASAGLVTLFTILTHSEAVGSTLIKAVVDITLFFISYRIQQTFVFADKKVKKEKSKFVKFLGKFFAVFGTVLLCICITVYSAGLLICYGPSQSLRDMLVISAKQASATKWAPSLFLTPKAVDEIMKNSQKINAEIIETHENGDEPAKTGEWDNCADEGIKLCYVQKPNFKAYILLVRDASRVKTGVSSDNFKTAKEGKRILDIAEKYDCLAAINGGEFSDPGGVGTGAAPIGLTYSFGKNVWNDGTKRTFIGFTKDNKLVSAENLTYEQAQSMGMRDGVSFQTKNTLIEHTGNKVKLNYSDGNTGASQRTAIGQRADGTVILLVTDGRSTSSIGATRNEIIDLMVEYGAVSAGMLDGGSSAMLYYEGYIEKYNINKEELDNYQFKGLVNRYKAFTAPRRMPAYFIVTKK